MRTLRTHKLHALALEKVRSADFPDPNTPIITNVFITRAYEALQRNNVEPLPDPGMVEMAEIVQALYLAENFAFVPEPSAPEGTIEDGRYRDRLLEIISRASEPYRTLEIFLDAAEKATWVISRHLSQSERIPQFGVTTGRLVDFLSEPHEAIRKFYTMFYAREAIELNLFAGIRADLGQKIADLRQRNPSLKRLELIKPEDFSDAPLECVSAFLGGTLFERIFTCTVTYDRPEFEVPEALRFSHTHIIGGSGHGKTQLIQKLFLNDLIKEEPASIIVIDPKGLLVERIRKLEAFAPGTRLSDRLIVIDPTDVEHPPALNMFHPASKRFRTYDESVRRMILNKAIDLYTYMFNTRTNTLTPKQATCFSFCIPVMLQMAETPGADIHTLMEFLGDQSGDKSASLQKSRFTPFIDRLSQVHREFFQHEYYSDQYAGTRKEIRQRLQSILAKPEFSAMFAARTQKIDLFECIQSGKILLVNTARGMLGDDSSQLFGRYIIALIHQAILERTAHTNPPSTWRDAYLYIDEAQDYLDDKVEALLDQARETRLGLIIVHQRLAQLSEDLISAIMTNTAVKYAGGVTFDVAQMSRAMSCTPDFLASQGIDVEKQKTEFACYVRGRTPQAVSLSVTLGLLESLPTMTADQYQQSKEINRQRTSEGLPPTDAARPSTQQVPASQSKEPDSIDRSDAGHAASDWS